MSNSQDHTNLLYMECKFLKFLWISETTYTGFLLYIDKCHIIIQCSVESKNRYGSPLANEANTWENIAYQAT